MKFIINILLREKIIIKFLKNIFMLFIIICIQFNLLQATDPKSEATFEGYS